ncbi:hypothetical protein CEXT_175761 [Caerostris extrusa]|uniref:Uncharacterized protein n=1 Tax=Caerostris extrusa TaxID=172846 RepID=A0AAV4MBD3_CAEEX|nr:hypothetical protein CEXT_175761 [Caerostris extrusa]
MCTGTGTQKIGQTQGCPWPEIPPRNRRLKYTANIYMAETSGNFGQLKSKEFLRALVLLGHSKAITSSMLLLAICQGWAIVRLWPALAIIYFTLSNLS